MTRRFLSVAVLTLCAVLAAVVSGLGPAQAQDGGQAQGMDFVDLTVSIEATSPPQPVGIVVTVINQGEQTAYDVDVVIRQAGREIGAAYVWGEISTGEYTADGTSGNWRIPRIEGYTTYSLVLGFTVSSGGFRGLKQYNAQVSSASFESEDRMRDNRATAWLILGAASQRTADAQYWVAVTADDSYPSPGETVNFTIEVFRGGRAHALDAFNAACVNVGLPLGATVGAPSFMPSDRSMSYIADGHCRDSDVYAVYSDIHSDVVVDWVFGKSDFAVSGIFSVGDSETPTEYSMTLPVTVGSGAGGIEQCVRAEMFAMPPAGFGEQEDNPNNNFAELCWGAAPDEPVVLSSGEADLFTWYDCSERTASPCDSSVSLELVALGGTAAAEAGSPYGIFDPDNVVVHISDPEGRAHSSDADSEAIVWSTSFEEPGHTHGSDDEHPGTAVTINTQYLDLETTEDPDFWGTPHATYPTWEQGKVNVELSGLGETAAPGEMTAWYINNNNVAAVTYLGGTGTFTEGSTYENTALWLGDTADVGYQSELWLQFSTLGTYEFTMTITAPYDDDVDDSTDATEYSSTGIYTFHVGPMAELGVRDGEASPDVPAGQYALTVEALNNGPETFADAEVTIDLPAGVTVAEYIASDGTYANGTWDLRELELTDSRRSRGIPEGAELTLILAGAEAGKATATATIANATEYSVCIDDEGEDVDFLSASEGACTSQDSTNTWHSTPVYDYDDRNNRVELTARAGTPGVGPDIPANPRTAIAWGFVAFRWDGMADGLYGWPVSHYETQWRAGGVGGSAGASGWGALRTVDDVYAAGSGAMGALGPVGTAGVMDANEVQGTLIIDAGVGPGETREYRVRAVNEAGVPGPWSFPVAGATSEGGKPSVPTGVRATPDGDTAIDVSWAAPQDDGGMAITRYEVQWSEDGQAENGWRRLGYVSAGAALTLKQGGLSETTTRHYRVRAQNGAGWGPWSEPAMATTRTGVPDAPGSFRARANGSTEIVLTWTEPYDGGEAISFYDLEWSLGSSGPWTRLDTVAVDTTEYADKGPAAGDKRYYRVRARNFNGAGAWSATRSATTTANAPDAPTNLTATADGENAINLSWGVPDGNGSAITGYRVERSRDGQAPWELLRSSGTSTSYTDNKDLYRGMTRYYRVAARNGSGWGEWSGVASGATEGGPAPPPGWVNLLRFTSVGSSSVGLAWSAPVEEGVPPVTGYQYHVTGPDGPEEIRETSGTSVSIGGLSPEGDYLFSVRAMNAVGGGPWETLTAHMGGSGSVAVSTTSLTVYEGGSASYTVRLSNSPPHPVLLNLGTPWFTGMSFAGDEPYGVILTPSGWTAPEGCDSTHRTWNQGVRVEFSIGDDDMATGDEIAVFTHEVFPLKDDDPCTGMAGTAEQWKASAYDPYRVGPGVLVTRRDND